MQREESEKCISPIFCLGSSRASWFRSYRSEAYDGTSRIGRCSDDQSLKQPARYGTTGNWEGVIDEERASEDIGW